MKTWWNFWDPAGNPNGYFSKLLWLETKKFWNFSTIFLFKFLNINYEFFWSFWGVFKSFPKSSIFRSFSDFFSILHNFLKSLENPNKFHYKKAPLKNRQISQIRILTNTFIELSTHLTEKINNEKQKNYRHFFKLKFQTPQSVKKSFAIKN